MQGTTLNWGFWDFGRVTPNVSFDCQYMGCYEGIREESELFHLGKRE